MVEVKRGERESTYSLLRRFTERLKESKLLIQARRARFYQRPKSKGKRKIEAIVRNKFRKERRRLIKLGLLERGEKMKSPVKISEVRGRNK